MASLTEMKPVTLEVAHENSVGTARRAALDFAKAVGFEPQACEEIALVAAELASNLVKHAREGRLILKPLLAGERAGLEIGTEDHGPGIINIERALADGFSTAGGLGVGLGTVNRLMDKLDIRSSRGRGTEVIARKWVRPENLSFRACPLAVGVATRSMLQGQPNGDAFVARQWAGSTLVGIIDGLGHGQFAHGAAQAARQYVNDHYDQPVQAIFHGTGRACLATRGIVMALARFDWIQGRLSFGSVGNIEARVLKNPELYSFVMRRGIVGVNAPNVVVTEHVWDPKNTMVLHSDGVTGHWGWKDFARLADQPASAAAQEILRKLAKEKDDATVMVIKNVTPDYARSEATTG